MTSPRFRALPALLLGGLFLFGCTESTGPDDDKKPSASIRGNVTLDDMGERTIAGFILVGEEWHFFAVPGQGETAITAVDEKNGLAYGWSRTTPESNDRGFVLDLKTNTFTTIQVPGVDRTIIRGTDGKGRVVGLANVRATADSYGFIYDSKTGAVTEMRRPGTTQGGANDLNEAGTLIGYNEFGAIGYVHKNGAYTLLETPGAGRLFPIEINEAGTIVGLWADTGAMWDPSRGFIATPSGAGYAYQSWRVANHPTVLAGINDSNAMAGIYYPQGIAARPTVFRVAGVSATPRSVPAPSATLAPWVEGLDNQGRVFGQVNITHVAADPEECGGHGHLHGKNCHCDTGYKQDPQDPGMCVAN